MSMTLQRPGWPECFERISSNSQIKCQVKFVRPVHGEYLLVSRVSGTSESPLGLTLIQPATGG